MEIKFTIKMKPIYMYRFQLLHLYKKITMILSVSIGLFGFVIAGSNIIYGNIKNALLMLLISILLVFLPPVEIYMKTKIQVLKSKVFQLPLDYILTNEGITISQNDQKGFIKWEDCIKATTRLDNILVYNSNTTAIIFPIECLGNKYNEVVLFIKNHMEATKTKGLK